MLSCNKAIAKIYSSKILPKNAFKLTPGKGERPIFLALKVAMSTFLKFPVKNKDVIYHQRYFSSIIKECHIVEEKENKADG